MSTNNFLKSVWDTQYQFNKKLYGEKYGVDIDSMSPEFRLKCIKEFILSGGKEMYEMLDELPWKTHSELQADGNNFLEEGIDAFKFLINCLLFAGYSFDDFEKKYTEKSKIVDFRYEQEKKFKQLPAGSKLCFVDIDGVLNYYPKEFLKWCYTQTDMLYNTIDDFKKENYGLYKKLKHEYRLTGKEASDSIVRQNLSEFILHCHKKGCKIILLTARPYKKYNRLFNDTIEWLDKNNVYYDFIFFEREKAKFVLDNFNGHYFQYFIDDDIENINRVYKVVDNPILIINRLLNTGGDDYVRLNSKIHVLDCIGKSWFNSKDVTV